MEVKTNINKVELILNGKYLIKPLMTIEEIKNSNLIEIMDEKSKINIEENLPYPLYIKCAVDGEEVNIRLDIVKERLKGVYIIVDHETDSEDYHDSGRESCLWLGNVQISQIEGINEVEYKKVEELCKIYGKFPSEDNLAETIKSLQDKIKKIDDQINNLNQEKINLETVENASKSLDDIYNKYELSGFDESILNKNLDNIAKYQKIKEKLKTTDNKDGIKLRKRIESYEDNVKKLEQIKTNLNLESNQISDSYSAYEKYKDIGTKKLEQLKKEFICNLKAKDELKSILVYDSDRVTQNFYKEKIRVININIQSLDKKINSIGVIDTGKNDDRIDYLRKKLTNEERYLEENHPLNDSNKENEIKKMAKSAMEDINSNMYNDLNAISELYNIESRIAEIEKEMELKKVLIELQKEAKVLEDVKEKLYIIDKYELIMDTRDKHKDNKLFKNSYEKKYEKEIKEYNQAQNDLKSMKIYNWDNYNKVKGVHDDKEKNLLKFKDISEITNLDNTKEFGKIVKYKNKRDEIIKGNSTALDIDIDENSYLNSKVKKISSKEELVKKNENSVNKNEANKALKANKNNIDKNNKTLKATKNKTLEQLKNELLCNLKAKDELKLIIVLSSDKGILDFCEEKLKKIYIVIKNLDNEIAPLGMLRKGEIDDKINYMKEKFIFIAKIGNTIDKKRYLQEYNSLNDGNKENQIREIIKNAMRELDSDIVDELRAINELYNIENEIGEVQKEINIKQQITELEEEGKRLENVKTNLNIVSRYTYITTFMNDVGYGSKYAVRMFESQIEAYKQAQKYLKEMKISDKSDYKEAKKIYDKKKKRMSANKDMLQIANLDNVKELEKIENYKRKQNEIIKKYRTM